MASDHADHPHADDHAPTGLSIAYPMWIAPAELVREDERAAAKPAAKPARTPAAKASPETPAAGADS